MPRFRQFEVKMQDGSVILLLALTHGHAIERAEHLARNSKWTGKAAKAATARLTGKAW